MEIETIHRWDVTPKKAIMLQESLRKRVVIKDCLKKIELVGGCDISYNKKSKIGCASVVIFSYPDLNLIEKIAVRDEIRFPYIPGLLTFREGSLLISAFSKVKSIPDCVIFDGQGIAHPRGLGIASHIGVWLNLPTIGCAKSRLVGKYDEVGIHRGESSPLYFENRLIGYVLRTKDRVKPVFVSPGHKIDFKKSVEVVIGCCKSYRLPEPTRIAHTLSKTGNVNHE